MPQEYTPELNEDFLERLLRPVKEAGSRRAAATRASFRDRGFGGDFAEFAGGELEDIETAHKVADLSADFNYNVAGLDREERLTREGRDFSVLDREDRQAFDADQRQRDREFQKWMRPGQNNDLLEKLLQVGGSALGTYAAGGFGRKAG